MRKHAVYGAIVREVMEGRSLRRSENDEIDSQFRGRRKNLDCRMSVSDARLYARAAGVVVADLRCQNAKFVHCRGIQSCRQLLADHLIERRKHVKQNQSCFLR